jgi:Tn3 transposase DDE domain-containing protein
MLLGYRFCPRLADLGDTRFYRINPTAQYGTLNGVARHRINTNLIAQNWDDLLRIAGSLKLGVVSGHELMQTFQGTGRHSSVARALAEYGRIGKTSIFSIWWMTRCTVAAFWFRSTRVNGGMAWLDVCSMVGAASCDRHTAWVRRINSARWAWC